MQIEPVGITAHASQSAGQNILKGQNGTLNVTLDEMSLIKFIKEKPKATQKYWQIRTNNKAYENPIIGKRRHRTQKCSSQWFWGNN